MDPVKKGVTVYKAGLRVGTQEQLYAHGERTSLIWTDGDGSGHKMIPSLV